MSKRSIIIAVLAVLLFVAALFSVVMDFKHAPEEEFEPDVEPEFEPGQEKNTGPRKGFYYNKDLKKYVTAKSKIEPDLNAAEKIEPGNNDGQ